jgi:hypothetical protein
MRSKKKITFYSWEVPSKNKDVYEILFCFKVGDSHLEAADEELNTTNHAIKVGVNGTLAAIWKKQSGISEHGLLKVLFEFARRDITQKIMDGILSATEEILLTTDNTTGKCPFAPSHIPDPDNYELEVEIPAVPIASGKGELEIASRIIDTRDNINALFRAKHGDQLLLLRNERSLLELLRQANNQEEFVYRLSSLATMIDHANMKKLRNITGIADENIKSIGLMDKYLEQINAADKEKAIKILRNISKLCQGYPIHGDQVDKLIEVHSYFALPYPIPNYNSAWKTILLNYLAALETILEALKNV